MMLGKLPVPGGPSDLDNGMTGALNVGGDVWTFVFLSIIFLLFPPMGDGMIVTEILSHPN